MEILNNFSSIYCFIAFILGAMFMFTTLCVADMCKTQEQKNKVHFYVTCELNHRGEIIYTLWIGEPYYTEDKGFVSDAWSRILAVNESFALYNLNYSDFKDMKIGEIKEVFINL